MTKGIISLARISLRDKGYWLKYDPTNGLTAIYMGGKYQLIYPKSKRSEDATACILNSSEGRRNGIKRGLEGVVLGEDEEFAFAVITRLRTGYVRDRMIVKYLKRYGDRRREDLLYLLDRKRGSKLLGRQRWRSFGNLNKMKPRVPRCGRVVRNVTLII